ncbi:oligoendopeptidase F [Halobacteriales archaeon QH_10_67_13]|nr:MAG: oligoendopeptidase F [Halobacteriales archaeon QH_10_67_13]
MSSVRERSEIDERYKWDLEGLYASTEDWEAAVEEAQSRLEDLRACEGRAVADAASLLETLETYEAAMRAVEDVTAYARMRRDEDTRDGDRQAMASRAQSLRAEAQSAGSFLEPAIQGLDESRIEAFSETEPALEAYEQYFDDIRRRTAHTRSPEIEGLLAELSDVTSAPGDIYRLLSNADMAFPAVEDPDGEAVEITLSNFVSLQKDPDRAFRRRVYEAFYDEWETVRNAVAAAYRKNVTKDEKLAAARNYESARAAALDRPNVPPEVYDTLVETVRSNLDRLHRHAELKRESIGADELRMWDLYMPLAETESPEIGYEQAREHVTAAVEPLGERYQERLAAGLEDRWVDVYETPGKRSGAYSGGTYDSQPYILMNYQDDVDSMYTLAHELGHSLHSELASGAQPYVYADYEIFLAEVASTVNETLLTRHLLETSEDERLRRHVLNQALERFRSTLYRQTMFAEFEHRAHEMSAEGKPLTGDRLDELYRGLKSEYYEPAVIDDRIAREWMRIPHFYRSFYVYQYATGISAAVAIAERIREEGAPAAKRYREFLESGSRGYPLELLETVGVDMTEAAPIERALSVYGEYLEEYERLA